MNLQEKPLNLQEKPLGTAEFAQRRDELIRLGQEQLWRFWDKLNAEEKENLQGQLQKLDLAIFTQLESLPIGRPAASVSLAGLEPPPYVPLPRTEAEQRQQLEAANRGEEAMHNGQVAVIIVAGGQGSRLGFQGPKGTMPIGPITGRTLFQYHFEKIQAMEKRYRCRLPVYIMTSETNHQQTRDFLQRNRHFGKDPSSVILFPQRMLPVFDENKKALLAAKDRLLLAPDGHGGLLDAIRHYQLDVDLQRRGVEYLFYFQVDNPLVQICDPVFIGRHLQQGAEMSAKTVYKSHAREKLGAVGVLNGRMQVIEYSEMTQELENRRGADGRWVFGQGSIAIHLFSVSFLRRLITAGIRLPYHVAHKKVACVDEPGRPVQAMAYKLEQFIFDAMPFADRVMIMETDRQNDFSPIKNEMGDDSAETAVRDLTRLSARWLEKCGIALRRDERGEYQQQIEISPLFAINENELMEKLRGVSLPETDILLEPPLPN